MAGGPASKALLTSPGPPPCVSREPVGYDVLVVEDEPDVAQLMRLHLQDLPARVAVTTDGESGLHEALSGAYELVVLDLRLPRLDGLEICRRLRMHGAAVPILVVSARGTESERTFGLELDADDYLPKPFAMAELLARARALLRRASIAATPTSPAQAVRVREVRIDPVRRRVHVQDREVVLTAKEFDLLHTLARDPGRVFGRAELLESVWQLRYEGYEHSVTCEINRLRAKIEPDPHNPRYILTVWGVGYKFAE